MKRFFILVSLVLFFQSCKQQETASPSTAATIAQNKIINEWIYSKMSDLYLWYDKIPATSTLDYSKTPDLFFENLLYDTSTTDRFSWIVSNVDDLKNSLNGISTTVGVDFKLRRVGTSAQIFIQITYPVKNGPAALAGIMRGDIITKINGTLITDSNHTSLYPKLLSSSEVVSVTLADKATLADLKTISLTPVNLTKNPVYYSTVFTKGAKKIGYFVYNQFVSEFDTEVRNVFANFKAQGVNELIMDFRYNGGGYVSSARTIGSLIVKNLTEGKLGFKQIYNPNIMDYLQKNEPAYFASLSTNFLVESNNLGTLDRVFFLTSNGTASSSELVMNMLSPYMEVIQIGTHTYGKPYGSITIEDDQKRWKWGMQPIIVKSTNSLDQANYGTKNGFMPTGANQIDELSYAFVPFGDESDPLLAKALSTITGTVAKSSLRKQTIHSTVELPISEKDNQKVMIVDNIPFAKFRKAK